MEECVICKKEYDKLKGNAHVIPRFLIKQTKVTGRNVFIGTEKIHEKNQKDIVVDYKWCESCERLFKVDDDFGKDFFDNQKFYINTIKYNTPSLGEVGLDNYQLSCAHDLKKFLISIILRHAVYLKEYEGKDILGPHFEPLRAIYFENKITDSEYPMCMLKYSDFDLLGYPTREKSGGINSIFTIIKNYRLWLYVDKRHIHEKQFEELIIDSKKVRALVISWEKTKMKKDILTKVDQFKQQQ